MRASLPTPSLQTARLRLRAFEDADANELFALHSSAYVLRYWDSPPWTERARAERFITMCRQMAQEGTGARLAVDRVSDGAFIGWCTLNSWNPDFRSASLGYCFADAAWGHGYATEAARALLRWAFDPGGRCGVTRYRDRSADPCLRGGVGRGQLRELP
ncbi:GNAT family N-acetyltransferase, partial [Streptomyces sp. NPDC001948]